MTDADIRWALSETDTLAITLWGEARGEELEGRAAVGCVIRNRMKDDRWPDTIKDVCLQPFQFSCWGKLGGPGNYAAVMAEAEKLANKLPATDVLLKESLWLADGLVRGIVRDRTAGSNHYCTRLLWEAAKPAWAKNVTPNCLIGRQAFFKL